jgi:competence protein ComEA
MLADIDKGRLVGWVAAALLLVAIALRLHAHGGGGGDAAPSVSVAPVAGVRSAPAGASAMGATGSSPGVLWVDVAGAVRRPGLYQVPAGSRVAAALERAGGISPRAERTAVNLAAPLRDGQQGGVPPRGAAGGAGPAGAAGGAGFGLAGAGAAGAGTRPISLAPATEAQLETLDGIGPALAGRIIQYRAQHGGFRSIDELKEVSGIGDKRFEAIRGSLVP